MSNANTKVLARYKRRIRIKKKFRPERDVKRLCVFRSNKHIYVQLIDDRAGKVLTSVSTMGKELKGKVAGKNNIASAKQVGTQIAKVAKELKIEEVCFDRNGFRYHGKIKALADAAREAGLKF